MAHVLRAAFALALCTLTACTSTGDRRISVPPAVPGTIYYVDKDSPAADDSNPGTPTKPWKTLNRAGRARELKPGDAVLIQSGVYRESMVITVSGEPGRPILFASAPGARVVIKGSELIRAPWTKVSPERSAPETYPNQYQNVWKVKLGEEFFTDPLNPGAFKDRARRTVAQVILGDRTVLLPVGPDSKVATGPNESWVVVEPVGRGLEDLRTGTYWFDRAEQTLYTRVGGEPGWYSIEVSVRDGPLQVRDAHDVVIRGLEVRHGLGCTAAMRQCQRVIFEDCAFSLASFCNLGMWLSSDCTVRRCELSWGGNSGLIMGNTKDCVIEDCAITFNNYRRFGAGWGDGGMKNIPGNKRTTIRRCEVAHNFSGGIWFDMLNVDTRILDNVIHHNVGAGIHYEANYGPAVIAGNLCYANGGDAISIVGHADTELMRKISRGEAGDVNERKFVPARLMDSLEFADETLYVVHNTVAENGGGIMTSHSDGSPEFGQTRMLKHVRVWNNLFLRNGQPGDDPVGKYVDLRFWIRRDKAGQRIDMDCHSDYNVFAAGTQPMLKPDYHYNSWGRERTLAEWQKIFGEDLNSRIVPVAYRCGQSGFTQEVSKELHGTAPLPPGVTRLWKPKDAKCVGASLTKWP